MDLLHHLTIKLEPDDATAAVLRDIKILVAATNSKVNQMATAFEVLKDEMQQTKLAVDALVAGLADIRSRLDAALANGMTPEQVAELKQIADDTQAEATAALGGTPAPAPGPEAS